MKRERIFKVRNEGEEPTAAYALWIDLTREQIAAVERLAGRDVSIREFMRGLAINTIEAKIPGIGKIYRRNAPENATLDGGGEVLLGKVKGCPESE